MSAHTKGPWGLIKHTAGMWIVFSGSLGRSICEMRRQWTDEDDANAHMIAAAPDLLDQLDIVRLHLVRDDFNGNDWLRADAIRCIEAAIAKAKGETT